MERYLAAVVYFALASVATVYDIKSMRIPDWLTGTGVILLTLVTALFQQDFLPNALFGGVLCFLFLWGIRRFSDGLGFGDVKYAVLTGLLCGVPSSAYALIVASLSALAVTGLIHLHTPVTRKTRIPFAPFISLGTLSVYLWHL